MGSQATGGFRSMHPFARLPTRVRRPASFPDVIRAPCPPPAHSPAPFASPAPTKRRELGRLSSRPSKTGSCGSSSFRSSGSRLFFRSDSNSLQLARVRFLIASPVLSRRLFFSNKEENSFSFRVFLSPLCLSSPIPRTIRRIVSFPVYSDFDVMFLSFH